MRETYTKRGASVRIERSGRSISTIVTREHGVATRERGHFNAMSLGEKAVASAPDVSGATDAARRLAALEGDGVGIERLIVVAGFAAHSLTEGAMNAEWSEELSRVHLTLANRALAIRVAVDLGATRAEALPLHVALEVAGALRTARTGTIESPAHLALSLQVAAALWRFVADHPALLDGGRLRLSQSPHPDWPFDGVGAEIEKGGIGADPPAALFRPSYRIPPVPAWFHVSATLERSVRSRSTGRQTARAVALLRPFRLTRTSVSARILLVNRETSAPADMEIPRELLPSAIVRMTGDACWFPLEAGAWGRETIVEGARLTTPS